MNTPYTNPNDTLGADPTVQAVVRMLDSQAAHYNVATQMRLNSARASAIAATRKKTPFWRGTPILAAAFAISAACAFLVLTRPQDLNSAAELEATALYEATFGANLTDDASLNSDTLFDPNLDQSALNETGLDEVVLDETILANDLEFYAWLSQSTNPDRARSGSDS